MPSKKQTAITKQTEKQTISDLLKKMQPEIARALPRHFSPDRMSRIALTEFRKNPELANCDMLSFLGSIIQCSQLGLEPGSTLGQVYLVPFYNKKRGCKEVQVIPGYKGLIELARRSGRIQSISPRAVYANDEFRYEYGLNESCTHIPTSGDPGELTHVYAVVRFKDGGTDFEVMTRTEIERVRDGLKFPNPVWKSHFDEMAKKTVIRRITKRLPLSPELSQLDAIEENIGSQQNHMILDMPSDDPIILRHDPKSISEVNDEIDNENKEKEEQELFEKVENWIANYLKKGGSTSQLEDTLGLPLEEIPDCNHSQLLSIWSLISNQKE